MIRESSTIEEINSFVNDFQRKLDAHKVRAFLRGAVLFQMIQLNCIRKHQTYSTLDDILSNEYVQRPLFAIQHNLIDFDYKKEKIFQGFALEEDSPLTPKQLIDARNILYRLNNTYIKAFNPPENKPIASFLQNGLN